MINISPVFRLAFASLMSRRVTAGLTVFAIAISVLLFVGVEKIRMGARGGFERTISQTDLIVGARSGPINLLLYSVFRIGAATNNITWATYQDITARPEVAWAVPLSLGDSHRGFRVVGTTPAFFTRYRYGGAQELTFSAGEPFEDVFDAVIGAEVAQKLNYRIGQEIVLGHGIGPVSFAKHDDKPFRIVGILKRTGTPVDRSVHVSLAGIEAIHIGWEGGARTPLAQLVSAEQVRRMDLQPKEITAFMLGLKSKIAVLRLQRDINTYKAEPLLGVMPAVALNELWSVVGIAETALSGIAFFVILVGLAGILTTILTSLNERRREMAILRSVGAGPLDIGALLVSEATFLALIGSLLGLALLYGGLWLAAPMIETRTGLALVGLGPTTFDLAVIAGVSGAGLLLGLLPAWRASRTSLADGLTVRI